jgi:hypothetical protein
MGCNVAYRAYAPKQVVLGSSTRIWLFWEEETVFRATALSHIASLQIVAGVIFSVQHRMVSIGDAATRKVAELRTKNAIPGLDR